VTGEKRYSNVRLANE